MTTFPSYDAAWKPVRIGAGGWVTGIDIAADGSMVARTDTYGAYRWDGTGWEQLVTSSKMPAGTHYANGVYEIRLAPSDTDTIYMQTLGTIFKSVDSGESWIETNFAPVWQDPNAADRMDGQKMAIDPSNADIVFAGTQKDGLFVTRNGGEDWTRVTAVPRGADANSRSDAGLTGIVFDPGSGTQGGRTQTIYVGTAGSGVYRSTDGGTTWNALAGGPKDVSHATISTDGTYYATGQTDGTLWKYDDGAWTQLLANRTDIHTVAVDPFDPSHIIAMMTGGALTESKDGGVTWGDGWNWGAALESSNDIPWLENSGQYMSTGGLWFDPNVEGKLWQSAGVGVWSAQLPDALQWWTPIVWNSHSQGIEQLVANDIIAPAGGDPVFASWDRPFFTMPDLDTYASSYAGGGFSMGWSIDYASSNPNFIVGISDWWGSENSGYSSDGGKTWHQFAGLPDRALESIGGSIAASSPTNIIWAPANGVAPAYTKDGGVTWTTITIPGKTDWTNFAFAYYLNRTTVAADRVLPNTFYLYDFDTGLHVSRDGGETWTLVHQGQISDWTYWNAKIEAAPGSAGELYFTAGPGSGDRGGAATGQMFMHSTDGGQTWNAVQGVQEVLAFGFGKAAAPGGPATVFIAGWVSGDYGVWMSTDGSNAWTKLGEYPLESLDEIRTISGDMDIYGRVYIGFGGSGYAYLDVSSVVPGTPAPTPAPDPEPLNEDPTAPATKSLAIAHDTPSGPVAVGAADADGDTLSYQIKTGYGPAKGSVAFANGSFTYTPNQNANGGDTFTIVVRDGHGGTAEQVVSVTIAAAVNGAPVAPPTASLIIVEDTPSGSVAIGATDPNGDTLSYQIKAGFGPAKGAVTLNGGKFVYTPNPNATGADSFTIAIADGRGGATEQVVSIGITAVNDAPTAAASQTVDVARNGSSGPIAIGAADVDGDALAYQVKTGFAPAKGSVSFSAGSFTYTPNQNATGQDSFKIVVRDDHGGTVEQAVTVAISPNGNHAPTAPAEKSIVLAEDTPSGPIAIGAADADHDTLSYQIKAGFGPAKGTVSFANGSFVYTPNQDAHGTDSFVIVVRDGQGGAVEQAVSLAIEAEPVQPDAFVLFTPDGFSGAVGGTGKIFGSNGFQDISVLADSGVVTFDGSFARGGDVIRLPGVTSEYTAALSGSFVVLDNGTNTINIPVGPSQSFIHFADSTVALSFEPATNQAHLGGLTISTIPAQVYAGASAPFPSAGTTEPSPAGRLILSGSSDVSTAGNLHVFGTNGANSLNILSGRVSLDGSFGRGGDILHLGESIDHYQAFTSGSGVQLVGDNGDWLSIPISEDATFLDFAGDMEAIWFDAETSAVKLGDYSITATSLDQALSFQAFHFV